MWSDIGHFEKRQQSCRTPRDSIAKVTRLSKRSACPLVMSKATRVPSKNVVEDFKLGYLRGDQVLHSETVAGKFGAGPVR